MVSFNKIATMFASFAAIAKAVPAPAVVDTHASMSPGSVQPLEEGNTTSTQPHSPRQPQARSGFIQFSRRGQVAFLIKTLGPRVMDLPRELKELVYDDGEGGVANLLDQNFANWLRIERGVTERVVRLPAYGKGPVLEGVFGFAFDFRWLMIQDDGIVERYVGYLQEWAELQGGTATIRQSQGLFLQNFANTFSQVQPQRPSKRARTNQCPRPMNVMFFAQFPIDADEIEYGTNVVAAAICTES